LSDLLRTVRLTGAVYFRVAGGTPWAAEQPPQAAVLPKVFPGADRLIAYHAVTEGRCFGGIVGDAPVALDAGEIIVFPHGDPHVMSSVPGMRAAPATPKKFATAAAGPLPYFVSYGDGAVSARLVCGFLAYSARPFNPLLESLPRVIKAGARPNDSDAIGSLIRTGVAESEAKRAGAESVLTKLSELMLIELVRRHLTDLPAEQAGWLGGLRDPFVGKALALLHAEPARDWTIEDLARAVGQSRSVLAERFTFFVGAPPLQYLTRWRMQLAVEALARGDATMAGIAAQIGYESEASFSRAFKKVVGVPPSQWRRNAATA
jgi:AraC-like DNA-binding protein